MDALQRYTLHTVAGGRVEGMCWTNDDEDTGYRSTEASWRVKYQSLSDAIAQTGGSHDGIACKVEVFIDGRMV